jgi:hypothetical protein
MVLYKVAVSAFVAVACATSVFAAAVNRTDSYLHRVGVSYVQTEPVAAGRTTRGAQLRDEPGEDREPFGFPIYDNLYDVPSYRVTSEDTLHAKCFQRDVNSYCLKGMHCGYECEQVCPVLTTTDWARTLYLSLSFAHSYF